MRKIALQDRTITKTLDDGTEQKSLFSDKNVLESVLGGQIKEGALVAEIRKHVRVLDKIENAKDGEDLLLEDEDYNFLKNKVSSFLWGVADKRIIDFVEMVENAEEVEAKT